MADGPLWPLFPPSCHWRGEGLPLASIPPHFPSPVSLQRGEVRGQWNMVYSVNWSQEQEGHWGRGESLHIYGLSTLISWG